MISNAVYPSILSTQEWIADGVRLRLPLVGMVSIDTLRKLGSRIAFILLLAAAGTLLMHPGDLVPGLEDLPVYQVLITCCLLASLRCVAEQFRVDSLQANAITSLVLLLVVTAAVSHLARGDFYAARLAATMVAKVAMLYLLVVGLVNSPARLRITLAMVALFVLGMTVVAVLQYHQVVHLPGIARVEQQRFDADSDATTMLVRLCGIGLFNDPNDLSLVLVISIIVCGYFLTDPRFSRATRQLALLPIAFFSYALYLTHSRGGMVSAVAGIFAFLFARIGARNALTLASLFVALLILVSWARTPIVDLNNPEDTFQTRLELWNGSFEALRSAPLLGIGQGRLVDEIGQVAHNSYLHAYAEMGLLGGTAFLGVFYLLLHGLWRSSPQDPELARMQPYMLALLAAYTGGLLSLSRCYDAPTLLLIAIATAYLLMASRSGPAVIPRLSGACLRRITGVGLFFLAATFVFLRFMQQGVS